jgi:hypothetical protein
LRNSLIYGARHIVLTIFVLTFFVTMASGCHAMWSANISHNSRGDGCVTSPLPTLIDLALATASAVSFTVAEDAGDYAGSAIGSAVFGLSGLWGIIEVGRCNADDKKPLEHQQLLDPQPRRHPGQESTSNATPEPADLTPIPKRSNPLRVPDDFLDRAEKHPETPITCTLYTSSKCPAKHVCAIKNFGEGICKPVDPPQE